ncbi:helix-turn-helix domain-containing protein [Geomonas subterranea]|uniref:Helix-turn-helix domain-containing protein n=1 Tax=Geomonas subterranea TaxID=2847989 RepID=A0ABX8LKY5_9BACT|nr:helix-turn-helix transcriptional regulator [Geomonas subterranea]QXE92676.1 helix-turn-helix domain-containing protein [Geomonas subterranea]QXM09225.1 helix-turn-helix domain-containing protein [Geomonas subterranea]
MEFGRKLRFLRLMQGMSQKDLACLVGTTPPYLARYEASVNHPKRDVTLMLSRSLRVSVEWLDFSTGAPFLLRVWAPFGEGDSKKHRAAVIREAEALFPEFLSSTNILHVVRYTGGNSDVHYLIAFQAIDSREKPAHDISVVIIFVKDELDEIISNCFDSSGIKLYEWDNNSVNVDPDIDSADVFEFYIENLSIKLPTVDAKKYISDYIRSESFEEEKLSWLIPINIYVRSNTELSQKKAEKLLYQAIENFNLNSSSGVKLEVQKK